MRKLVGATLMGVLLTALGIGISGCTDESSEKSVTTTKGPGGTVKQTEEKKVETSGNNPPAPTKTP
jgi:hypothetical protein